MTPYRFEMSFKEFYIRQLIRPEKVALMTEWLGDKADKKWSYTEWVEFLKEFDKEHPDQK